jgi:hypothetical protein
MLSQRGMGNGTFGFTLAGWHGCRGCRLMGAEALHFGGVGIGNSPAKNQSQPRPPRRAHDTNGPTVSGEGVERHAVAFIHPQLPPNQRWCPPTMFSPRTIRARTMRATCSPRHQGPLGTPFHSLTVSTIPSTHVWVRYALRPVTVRECGVSERPQIWLSVEARESVGRDWGREVTWVLS